MQLLRSAAASAVSQGVRARGHALAFSLQYLQQQHQLVQQRQRSTRSRCSSPPTPTLTQQASGGAGTGAAAGAASQSRSSRRNSRRSSRRSSSRACSGRPLSLQAAGLNPQYGRNVSGGHAGGGNSVNSGLTSSISSIASGGSASTTSPRTTPPPYRTATEFTAGQTSHSAGKMQSLQANGTMPYMMHGGNGGRSGGRARLTLAWRTPFRPRRWHGISAALVVEPDDAHGLHRFSAATPTARHLCPRRAQPSAAVASTACTVAGAKQQSGGGDSNGDQRNRAHSIWEGTLPLDIPDAW